MSRVPTAVRPVTGRSFRPNPPDPRRLIEALRELGYESYASVLDLIDNCIDAQAKQIEVTVSESKGDIVISIDDDGIGMDEQTLDEALRLGSDTSRDIGDLGKFGLGLVTASIGLSKRLEVFTRTAGGNFLYGGFDLDDIVERNEFVKWVLPANGHLPSGFQPVHGTRVQLSKTDRLSNRNVSSFAGGLRRKIGQAFRKFLKSGVRIVVNGRPVEAVDPLMLSDPETRLVMETTVDVEDKTTAVVKVVYLPDYGGAGNKERGIIPENSGFYVLRNNREIMEAQTFGWYRKHPDFSHFRAELSFEGSLDDVFHTDVKKMSITPTQSFIDRLRQATQLHITESGRQGRSRAHATKGEVDHSLAESNIARRTQLIPKPDIFVEMRKPRSKSGSHSTGTGEGTRTPHVAELKTVSGLRVRFEEGDYGEQGQFYYVKPDGRTIVVTYNKEHPFWREFVEHAEDPKVIAILDYLVFALANTELIVPDPARIVKENMNSTLVGLLV